MSSEPGAREASAYPLLVAAVFALFAVHLSHRDFVGDFWEHAAVVRELAAHPVAPRNPLVATTDPHPMFSPYTLVVALGARWLDRPAVDALATAGLINLLLLVLSLRTFVARLLGSGRAFFALLFVLVLWGHLPWFYSGFLHLDALGYALSYPATFATALMFAVLALELRFFGEHVGAGFAPGGAPAIALSVSALALPAAVVLVTHPLTAIPTFVLMAALAFDTPVNGRKRNLALVGVAVTCAVVLALAWPYYSMARLLGAEARATYATNRFMYPGLNSAFAQLYAAALGVPLLLARWRRNRRDALVVAFAGLAVVYGWGAWSERWSYGRVLSSMVLVLQLAIADWVVRTLGGLGERATRVRSLLLLGPLAALLVAMAFELAPTVERFAKGRDVVPAYERYGFLGEHVDEGAVVMSRASLRDDAASYVVAAFGGRVVAAPVLMFVADADTRLADVRRFFQPQTPQAVRRELLAKYDARYLLVQGSADDPAMRWAWDLGSVLYNQADVFLFDVRGGA